MSIMDSTSIFPDVDLDEVNKSAAPTLDETRPKVSIIPYMLD